MENGKQAQAARDAAEQGAGRAAKGTGFCEPHLWTPAPLTVIIQYRYQCYALAAGNREHELTAEQFTEGNQYQ